MNKTLIICSLLLAGLTIQAQTWSLVPSNAPSSFLNGCSFGNANTIYISGGDNSLLKSVDGGLSFQALDNAFIGANEYTGLSAITFVDKNTGYITGGSYEFEPNNGFIFKTTDGGENWTSVLSQQVSALNNIAFSDPQNGIAIGGEVGTGLILRTTDAGQNWTNIYNSGAVYNLLTSVQLFANNNGFVVGNDEDTFAAKLFHLQNGEISNTLDFSDYILFTDVFFIDDQIGFVTAYTAAGNAILKTENGGTSWSQVYFNPEKALNSITFVSADVGYAVGAEGLVVKTADGGSSWSSVSVPTQHELKDVVFYNNELGIAVGEAGTILRFSTTTTNTSDPFQNLAYAIYPNPVSNTLQIKGEVDIDRLLIYNQKGQLVKNLDALKLAAKQVDVSELASGAYFIKIEAQGQFAVFKTLKI